METLLLFDRGKKEVIDLVERATSEVKQMYSKKRGKKTKSGKCICRIELACGFVVEEDRKEVATR